MKRIIAPFFVCLLGLAITACAGARQPVSHDLDPSYIDEKGNLTDTFDVATHSEEEGPKQAYTKGVVLVKSLEDIDIDSLQLDIKSVEKLFIGSPWQKIILGSTEDTVSAVHYLRKTNKFQKVDYDYVMNNSVDDIDEIDVSANELAGQQNYLDSMGIRDGWGYAAHHNLGGENGGGSPDVVVAVIDTGVDINHLDLRNNIWTNVGEIPNNGVDDDNNGYIDDVYGWDCVNEDNYPMDDNGHGTHVAGIIAAENNTIGTVGVAFNCKIMPVKAANRSGELASADIAQAITYAYMNGADVINMSFGGYSISTSVQEALEEAYMHCTLVASAGNDKLCNQPGCPPHAISARPSYPAAFPYVIGVMSCDESLSSRSEFSNYDHYISNKSFFAHD